MEFLVMISLNLLFLTSRGGLEVECLLHKLHDSTSVGLNPARRKKISVVIQILLEALSLIMFKNKRD